MMRFAIFLSAIFATTAAAEHVVPTRTLRAQTIITEMDLTLSDGEVGNGYDRLADVIGQETRVVLYAGRPILFDDIGPPALVTRNEQVRIEYSANGLRIAAEGRALERGSVGDVIRLMNLSSRVTLFGQVQADGTILVQQ